MAKGYWLVKSEPSVYPWERLVKEKRTTWDGIRSFEARNNLRAMKKGDLVLFYHSNEGKEVVGLATVVAEATPEQTDEGDWSVVELSAKKALAKPVTLAQIKAEKKLASFGLVKKSRLSVVPATEAEFALILELSGTKL
ncbi:MAG: RNA-binding protein [Polyangiaceae bacterium]|jgi:predicted RNA-binding protein with PUA-like domain|nr:RNA-binding protein [Polyangiaceae bacterium]